MQNVTVQFQEYLPIPRHLGLRGRRRHKIQCQLRVSSIWTRDPTRTVWHSVPEVVLCPGALPCNVKQQQLGVQIRTQALPLRARIWCQVNPGYNDKSQHSASDKIKYYIRIFTADEFVLSINSCLNTAAKACVALGFNRQCRKGTQLVRKWAMIMYYFRNIEQTMP